MAGGRSRGGRCTLFVGGEVVCDADCARLAALRMLVHCIVCVHAKCREQCTHIALDGPWEGSVGRKNRFGIDVLHHGSDQLMRS